MTLSTVLEGVALTLLGDAETGLSMTDKGIELYQGITAPPMFWPLILHLRGLVHSYSGHPDRGLALIDRAVALVGSDDFTDIWISRGDVMRLLPAPDLEGAEGWYRDAIEAAKRNDCGQVSCRPWTRLVDLRRARGVSPDGSDELWAVCDTFTEGFEEHDLAKARTVLGLDPVGATLLDETMSVTTPVGTFPLSIRWKPQVHGHVIPSSNVLMLRRSSDSYRWPRGRGSERYSVLVPRVPC